MSPIISSFTAGSSFGRRSAGGAAAVPVFSNTLFNQYNFSGSVFSFNSPGEILLVDVYGAQGGTDGQGSYSGGLGGRIQAYIQVTSGQTIYGLVGAQGSAGGGRGGGGGGGFSALWVGSSDPGSGTWLIGAGGGGGSGGNGADGVNLFNDSGGGDSTVTQSTSRSGGSPGAGGNGGGAGGAGTTGGGGSGGSGGCDCSGGGGGGGSGAPGGGGAAGYQQGTDFGGGGGYGGGGGAGGGGWGGYNYRVISGGGGGGGWNGGNGGEHGAYAGRGGSNFYLSQTISGFTQLQNSSKGVRSSNGYMEIRY